MNGKRIDGKDCSGGDETTLRSRLGDEAGLRVAGWDGVLIDCLCSFTGQGGGDLRMVELM